MKTLDSLVLANRLAVAAALLSIASASACAGPVPGEDGGGYGDSGMNAPDGSNPDGASTDSGPRDDGGPGSDTGAGADDAGGGDAGRGDGGGADAGRADAGSGDASATDASTGMDASTGSDAGTSDGGTGSCATGFVCATGCCAFPTSAALAIDDGFDPDLEIDGTDTLHLGFRRAGAIHLARWSGADWLSEVVVPEPAGTNSLNEYEFAIDPTTDDLTLVYGDLYGVRFRRRTGSTWMRDELLELHRVTAAALGLSFTFDEDGTPHVFYVSGTEVHYATRGASGWSVEVVPSPHAGFNASSIVVDSTGTVHVAYFARRLYYAKRDATGWTSEVVAENGWTRGMHPSLALDGASRPHISYHDHSDDDVRYAYWDGAAWNYSIVDDYGLYRGGSWTALLLDAADRAVVAHQGWSPRNSVRYSTGDGATWATTQIAMEPSSPSSTNRSFGLFIQMVRDSHGDDHLVYQHSYLSSSRRWVYEIHYSQR